MVLCPRMQFRPIAHPMCERTVLPERMGQMKVRTFRAFSSIGRRAPVLSSIGIAVSFRMRAARSSLVLSGRTTIPLVLNYLCPIDIVLRPTSYVLL